MPPMVRSILLGFALFLRRIALIEQDELRIERPIANRFELDFEPRLERVDLLDQVEIDHRAIVDPQRNANRIERDLQSPIEIAPFRGFEIEGEINADQRFLQL